MEQQPSNNRLSNDEGNLTLQETNEMLKTLPKILKQMTSIVMSTQQTVAHLQNELKTIKSENDKFKSDILEVFNIISEKVDMIDRLEFDLSTVDQIYGKRLSDLEDELILTQQVSSKSWNEILKFKEHWKI
ncbi:hypothetical protein [Clostridium sp.]|uniref:hypothetical protein n=1 Tax=Clostridium sp. TaxID=1506 RepID=UPI003F3BDB47